MNNTTEKIKNKSHELYEKLKTERDELKLQTHLMKAELNDVWHETEKNGSVSKLSFQPSKKLAKNQPTIFTQVFQP